MSTPRNSITPLPSSTLSQSLCSGPSGAFPPGTLPPPHALTLNPLILPGGDAHLGGDDWDAAISNWVERNYLSPAGLDPGSDPRLRANLRALAQAAKHSLSEADEVVLR